MDCGRKGQSSSDRCKDRKESLSPSRRHKNHREKKVKSSDTVRHRQEDTVDSDSTDSSSFRKQTIKRRDQRRFTTLSIF